jgi:hypothetical protein
MSPDMPRPGFLVSASTLAVVATLALGAPARAQALASPACGTENLLAGKLPTSSEGLRGNTRLVTDGEAAPEGAQWDAPVAVTFEIASGALTYDLGQPTPVSAFSLQADANDIYKIWGSLDGAPGTFKLLVEAENVVSVGHGLRTRPITIAPTMVRYLRVGEPEGDNFYSISEFQAFCEAPSPFPPHLRIVNAPPAKVAPTTFWSFSWWDNDASSRVEMGIAFFALAVVGWGIWLARKGTPGSFKKTRDRLLMVVGLLSFCAYWNFFAFHFGNYFHVWDTFHYYVGSKYFNELSYDRLYECDAVADAEDPSLRRRVELRKIMNLRTNMMESTNDILAHPERCKSHFTPERWEAFKKDVTYFRLKNGVKRWEDAQGDHGYNATPVWNIMGTWLSNIGPASDDLCWYLTRIDPLFIIGLTLMTWWAYGWRTLSVALAVFATCFPCRFYWTGGAFLRWDWLFYFVGGVCLVRKEKPFLGGLFLGYSTLLRVFPGFAFIGPGIVVVQQLMGPPSPDRPWWKPAPFASLRELTARIDRRYVRLIAGAALAFVVLVPVSFVVSNGPGAYREFKRNSEKHENTPLTNFMGLKTVLIYRPSEAGHFLKNDKLEDPWGHWKQVKLETGKRMKFPLLIAVIAFTMLLWRALRGRQPWVALSMGATMMAIPFELTCYYYSFMFVVALLYEEQPEAGALLLAATALSGFIDWAPTRYLPNHPPWNRMLMPTWFDEQYTWMSVFIIAAFVWALYRFAYPEPQAALAGVGTAALPDSDDGVDGVDGVDGDAHADDKKGAPAASTPRRPRRGTGKGGARRRK